MKKTVFTFACFSMLFFSLPSCGGSSSESDDASTTTEKVEMEDDQEENQTSDLSSISSAEEAMTMYKTRLEEYAEAVKSGNSESANELKEQLDELKKYAETNFEMAQLKAMADLSKLALDLEAGKNVDLKKAFGAFEKSMEALKNIPLDEESKEALEDAKDAMNQLKGLGL